jgi:uncharacterized protein (TIGR02265 family)
MLRLLSWKEVIMARSVPTLSPLAQVTRPVMPDSAKRFLSPPEELLSGLSDQLTARQRAAFQAEFGTHIGQPSYPLSVALRLIDWAAVAAYPDLPLSEARRRRGREGLLVWRQQSILGRVMTAAFPVMGLERILRRVPQNISALTNFGTRWVVQEGPQHWWYCTSDDPTPPDFTAGMLDALAELTGVQELTITWTSPSRHERAFEIRWLG